MTGLRPCRWTGTGGRR